MRAANLYIFLSITALTLQTAAYAGASARSKQELGDFRFFHGDVTGAIEAYEEAAQLNPDSYEIHMTLLNLYQRQKRTDEAIKQGRQLLRLKPGDATMHVMLSGLLREKGLIGEALSEVEQALQCGSKDAWLKTTAGFFNLQLGKLERARTLFDEVAQSGSPNEQANLGLAILDVRENKLDDALKQIDSALNKSPNSVEGHKIRGDILVKQNRSQDAIKEFETALRLRPDFQPAMQSLALLYMKLDEYAKAESAIKGACELKSPDATSFYVLAGALEKQKKFAEAAAQYENAAFLDDNPELSSQSRNRARQLRAAFSAAVEQAGETMFTSSPEKKKLSSCEDVFGVSYADLITRQSALSETTDSAVKKLP